MTLLDVFSILIIFQLTLMVLFLFTSKRGKVISNRLLASFFLLLLFNIVDGMLSYTGWYVRYSRIANLEDGFVFLLGPVVYLYTTSIVFRDFELKRIHWVHVIPFVIVSLSYQIFYHSRPSEYREMIQDAIARQRLPPAFYLSVVVIYTHVAAYLVAAYGLVLKYRRQIRDQFSTVAKINLDWLTFMILSVMGILVVSAANTFLPIIGMREYFPHVFLASVVFLFAFSSLVIWKGMRQPEVFSGIAQAEVASPSSRRYMQPAADPDEIETISRSVTTLMETTKPYLDPDLSLEQLASLAQTSPKKLSQTINEKLAQNFFDFVNTYRIEEARRIFSQTSDPGITVLEVMYQSGFNSKSSFNTLFRQKTGMTPSAFKKSVAKPPDKK